MKHPVTIEPDRFRAEVPAEFVGVENKLWLMPGGAEQECPTATFQIPNNTLGLNLRAITEIVVTRQKDLFGLEWIQENELNPNMLLMGALSVAATLEAWQAAQD